MKGARVGNNLKFAPMGAIPPDHLAEVSRGHSRRAAGEAREAPQGRKAG